LFWAAVGTVSAFAADQAPNVSLQSRMLTPLPVSRWSGFYPAANPGADRLNKDDRVRVGIFGAQPIGYEDGSRFLAGVQSSDRPRSSAFLGAAAPARAYDAFPPADSGPFGRLGSIAVDKLSRAADDLAKRLMRKAVDDQTRDALFGSKGSLSAGMVAKNLAEMSAVVEGVNDWPDSESAPVAQDAQAPPDSGPDILARVEAAPPAQAGARPRAFDASEGTRLDPLLNKTYDLTYPKVVPLLK
jgi:hypothetical protein